MMVRDFKGWENKQDENDAQEKRIAEILGAYDAEVSEESLDKYKHYLVENVSLPCQVTGIEDFEWEEMYVLGVGDEDEYNGRKKTEPSYSDKYDLLMNPVIYPRYGLLVKVKRISDKKRFVLPLAELETVEDSSKNQQLLDDFSVWFVNNR